MEIKEEGGTANLFLSIASSLIVLMFLSQVFSSYVIKPLVFDGAISKSGRYGFVFEAWDTISEDDSFSAVALGSSLTQFAINGSCMSYPDQINDFKTYNLGVPGSAPYLDMVQVERGVNSNPDVVILEVNPISLTKVSSLSANNIQLRLTLSSLFLKHQDYGGWYDLLLEEDKQFVDGFLTNRYRSESMYFGESLEEMIGRFQDREDDDRWWEIHGHWYSSTPYPGTDAWNDYLVEPTWLQRYLSKLTPEELQEYENKTIPNLMKRERYNPDIASNLNFEALNYIVSRFSENDINVLLVSYPIHPVALDSLAPNQFDGHNSSMEQLTEKNNVRGLNLIWDGDWRNEDFYDYEHLDVSGREKICSILSSHVNDSDWY